MPIILDLIDQVQHTVSLIFFFIGANLSPSSLSVAYCVLRIVVSELEIGLKVIEENNPISRLFGKRDSHRPFSVTDPSEPME
jgi:hypothetical protein